MNELIVRCVDADGCRAMELAIKRRGQWLAYAEALTGDSRRPDVPEEKEVLWGYAWERRRAAAQQVTL